jgi:acyl-CoA synthetase (AMP-forming)/AMP-acid ligase II
MVILQEHQVNADLDCLAQAWAAKPTFALIPDRSGVDPAWIESSLAALPKELHVSHFAMLTSGSTGRPKLIIGQRARTEELARQLHLLQESEPVREAILTLALTYTYSFVNQWVWSRVHDRRLLRTPGLANPDELAKVLANARDAMLCLVGAQVPLLAEHFPGRSFIGVIRVHFAGGRFPQERLGTVRSLFPNATIFNNYGCAEAMPRLSLRRADASDDPANIGRPLPFVELSSDDQHALLFRSRYGAVGIIEDPGGFRPITPTDWVPTGDLGEPVPDGTWRLRGRASEVFKRYGEKISLPALLGAALSAWQGQAAFYRETDPRGEEGHVLVLAPSANDDSARAVLRALAAAYPRTHWPLRIESLPLLPTLPSGKIDSRSLSTHPDRVVHWHQRF